MNEGPPVPTERLYRKREIAEHYRVSEKTVESWMRDGRIAFTRTPGGNPRFFMPKERPDGDES